MANVLRAMLQRLNQSSGNGVIGLIAAAGAAYGINESIYTVEGGHRGIMFSRLSGVLDDIVMEGFHIRVPWLQYPVIFDIRARPHRITSPTGSKDLQMVNISLRVLSRPMKEKLPEIYRNLGTDYDERVLPSIVNECLKSTVAQFNAAQLITRREEVSKMIRDSLTERAREFWLILDDVSITDLTFGAEYTSAVEAKQVAQQDAQRAALYVEKARQERQQKIVQAEGEAESARLIGEAVSNNPAFLTLRRIDAAREVAETVSKSANRVFLNSDSLLLNVSDAGGDFENQK